MMRSGTAIPEDFTRMLLDAMWGESLAREPASSAVAMLRQGQFREAAEMLDDLTLRSSAPAAIWLLAGYSYLAAGDIEESLYFFDTALRREPTLPLAHYCKGMAHLQGHDYPEAQRAFSTSRQLMPQFAAAALYDATALSALFRYDEALKILEALRTEFPLDSDVLTQSSLVLLKGFGRAKEALALCDTALAQSGWVDARRLNVNRALALRCLGRYEESVDAYDELLAGQDDQYVRWQRSLALLTAGEYGRAWEDYGLRWVNAEARQHEFPFAQWQPLPKPDETILVLSEQGLGDQILFASCLPDLMQEVTGSGARIVLECDQRLEALFTRSFPEIAVVARNRESDAPLLKRLSGQHCRQIFLGDLPRIFRNVRSDFLDRGAFLKSGLDKSEAWKKRLMGLGSGKKIGISWRGGSPATNRAMRSVDLGLLSPILQASNCQFVSLQYGDVADELTSIEGLGLRIHHFKEALADYDETAALIEALDGVVSVTTSVVHLAGGLGKPVAVLVPAVPEWAFGGPDDRMPWYPSVRLMRQNVLGNWDAPIRQAVAFLEAL